MVSKNGGELQDEHSQDWAMLGGTIQLRRDTFFHILKILIWTTTGLSQTTE